MTKLLQTEGGRSGDNFLESLTSMYVLYIHIPTSVACSGHGAWSRCRSRIAGPGFGDDTVVVVIIIIIIIISICVCVS
jgi:hypothetical protein